MPEVKEEAEAGGRRETSSSDGSHQTMKHHSVQPNNDSTFSNAVGKHVDMDISRSRQQDKRSSASSSADENTTHEEANRSVDDKEHADTNASITTSISEGPRARRPIEEKEHSLDKGKCKF